MCDHDSSRDPNSPERRKAARYAKAGKVCSITGTVLAVAAIVAGAGLMKADNGSPVLLVCIVPMAVLLFLGGYFERKDLTLRCTERTTAHCIDTVRRHRGRRSTRHPIVEYEVDGVRHTAELSISCSRKDVGELYTIYYDPLDPDTVRDQ